MSGGELPEEPRTRRAFRVGMALGSGRWPSEERVRNGIRSSKHLLDSSPLGVECMIELLDYEGFSEVAGWMTQWVESDGRSTIRLKRTCHDAHKAAAETKALTERLRLEGRGVVRVVVKETLLDIKYNAVA